MKYILRYRKVLPWIPILGLFPTVILDFLFGDILNNKKVFWGSVLVQGFGSWPILDVFTKLIL